MAETEADDDRETTCAQGKISEEALVEVELQMLPPRKEVRNDVGRLNSHSEIKVNFFKLLFKINFKLRR